jgi:hypothetical protein
VDGVVRLPMGEVPAGRYVAIGHHDGQNWEVVPARMIDGKAVARVSHFSDFLVFLGKLWEPPREVSRAAVRIKPPGLRGFLIQGGYAWAEMDLLRSGFGALEGSVDQVPVKRFRVLVSRPRKEETEARDDLKSFEPIRDANGEVCLSFGDKHPRFPIVFDPDSVLPVQAETKMTANAWRMRLVPVFDDGVEGEPSASLVIPTGVAEAYLKLRQGLIARMSPEQADLFRRRTEENPYYVVIDYTQQTTSFDFKKLWPCYSSRAYARYMRMRDEIWLGLNGFGHA